MGQSQSRENANPPPAFNLAERLFRDDTDSSFYHEHPPNSHVVRRVYPVGAHYEEIVRFWGIFAEENDIFMEALGNLNDGLLECLEAADVDTTRFRRVMGETTRTTLSHEWVMAWDRGLLNMMDINRWNMDGRDMFVRWNLASRMREYLNILELHQEGTQIYDFVISHAMDDFPFAVSWFCSIGWVLLQNQH